MGGGFMNMIVMPFCVLKRATMHENWHNMCRQPNFKYRIAS